MSLVSGAELPVRSGERWYKVVSPKHHRPIDGLLLAEQFRGEWTHWEGAAKKCLRHEDCPGCKSGKPSRWTGYMPIMNVKTRDFEILACTEYCVREMIPIAQQNDGLRGLYCHFYRDPKKGKKGELRVNAAMLVRLVQRVEMPKVPQPFPIEDSLNRLWGVNAEYLKHGKKRMNSVLRMIGENDLADMIPEE